MCFPKDEISGGHESKYIRMQYGIWKFGNINEILDRNAKSFVIYKKKSIGFEESGD